MDFDLTQLAQEKIYNLVNGLVAPRPIAWITSMDLAGKIRVQRDWRGRG